MRVEGEVAAELYQTYGVPPELFEALAAEHNLAFDWEGYRKAMLAHGEASGKQQHTVMGAKGPIDSLKHALHSTEFLGYQATEAEAVIKGIVSGVAPDDHLCDTMEEQGHSGEVRVVLDRTPFYGESGGQVGDTGRIIGEGFEFEVTDTQKDGQLVIHYGHLRSGKMFEGAEAKAIVDSERRDGIRRAHSATHILHHALQKQLGSHAQQQGSKVEEDWLRFDFSNPSPVSKEEIASIAEDVVKHVAAAEPIAWEVLPLADARGQGAMMLFGEKYPDPVRMVSMGAGDGAFSKELCGGTHLQNTSEVSAFEILSEEGVSAGTRRITALTGRRAAEHAEQTIEILQGSAELLGCAPIVLASKVQTLLDEQRELKKLLASGGTIDEKHVGGMSTIINTEKPTATLAKAVLAEAAQLLSVTPLAVKDRIEAISGEVFFSSGETRATRFGRSDHCR